MKAITVSRVEGHSPVLAWSEVSDPMLAPNEVLVATKATAVNRADLLQARGLYPPPPGQSEILGLEVAGNVVECGSGVTSLQPGARVCALISGGGYAELVAVPSEMLIPLPENWTFEQGAAFPEVWYTAYLNLFIEGRLLPGESVLIHAGASGVGTAAVQLAVEKGCRVMVTVGSDEKVAACQALGAEVCINYRQESFRKRLSELTAGTGVDLILDCVGASYFEDNLHSLARGGRLVLIGLLGGAKGEIDLRRVLTQELQITGSVLRPKPLAEKITLTQRIIPEILPKFGNGAFRLIIDSIFPIEEASAAHEKVAANATTGKVVLRVG